MTQYHYTMCGLDYVYLRNGFQFEETPYGSGVSIEKADSLDQSIAYSVITSPARLRGQEVRFLRVLMDQSQSRLALSLGIKRITVARWEGAPSTPIPGPADRALRFIAAATVFPQDMDHLADDLNELMPFIENEKARKLVMVYHGIGEDDDDDTPDMFPHEADPREPGWRINGSLAA
ncbi:MAG: hypothetical protein P1U49_15760 [Minwuia sp.]|nr:hypothetical protein [Minwuia sp.]